MKKTTLTLGIMSGTSIDGVDYALCAIDDRRLELRQLWHVAFPEGLRKRLDAAARNGSSSWELAQAHHDLGRFYAAGARRGRRPRPQLVGVHGQTVFHNPDRRWPATLQLGEPAYLAEALRVPVINNFRVADIAAGGEGAPLATLFHVRVFGQRGRHVCVQNIGGIGNVTSIDWRHGPRPRVLAFDTGPGNVLMDLALRQFSSGKQAYDRGGEWARRGAVCEPLVKKWLAHPFLRRTPPKSTGRELFGEPFFETALQEMRRRRLSQFDFVSTFNAFTARSVVENYRRHLPAAPDTVVLAGGGAANRVLSERIRIGLVELNDAVEVTTSDALGWPRQAIEPAAFALLAWARLNNQPGNLPETTGARRAALCGQITEA